MKLHSKPHLKLVDDHWWKAWVCSVQRASGHYWYEFGATPHSAYEKMMARLARFE
jgi:hypothetical protein